jgi:hypothetical protein
MIDLEKWRVCSRCGRPRTDPADIREGFCKFCADFTDMPEVDDPPPSKTGGALE